MPARWPKVLRRVAGYNLDIFDNQSERPYTADGSVNLAHLLVGAEGTLAFTRSLTLKLAELPRAKVLGVVNFPTFRAAMAAAQHIVKLGPTAVELVDRTMIELSLANPAFRPTVETALINTGGEPPAAILLVEFCGANKAATLPQLAQLVELMGDLGLPGSVVQMPDDAAQKNLWEVRKAGLNIMMSLKGDGKPVSFIEDCAVPLEHLAEYTDALTEGVRPPRHARHLVRARLGGHAARAAHPGHARCRPWRRRRQDARHRRRGQRAGAQVQGRLQRRARRRPVPRRVDRVAVRPEAINEAFRAIKNDARPDRPVQPGKIIDPPKMDDGAALPLCTAHGTASVQAHCRSRRCSTGRHGTSTPTR